MDGTRTTSYTYDAWARLKMASNTQWTVTETYDRYGNRKAQSAPVFNSVTVDPNTNRFLDPGYSYDANGNMTADGQNTLAYDGENRVVSSTQAGATSSYTYDGNSLRVKKISGGATTVYIFSGTEVIAEYAAGAAVSSPAREYIYSGSQLLATMEGISTKYHHRDQLSVRVTTDPSGVVIGQQGHFPFGEDWYNTSTTTKWKFTSYERDPESGNDYAIARHYSSRLGRFLSPDLLGGLTTDPQSLNRYAYSRNDPINLVDPLGLDFVCVWDDGTHDDPPEDGGETQGACEEKGGKWRDVGGSGSGFIRPGTCLDVFLDGIFLGNTCDPTGPRPGPGDPGGGGGGGPSGNSSGSNGKIIDSNGNPCTPSVFNPSCKPPSCLAVFLNAAGEADPLNLPALPPGFGPDDAAKAAATALATKHIIERGLVIPLDLPSCVIFLRSERPRPPREFLFLRSFRQGPDWSPNIRRERREHAERPFSN